MYICIYIYSVVEKYNTPMQSKIHLLRGVVPYHTIISRLAIVWAWSGLVGKETSVLYFDFRWATRWP